MSPGRTPQSRLRALLLGGALLLSCSKPAITGAKVNLLPGPLVPAGIRRIELTLTLEGRTASASLSDPRGADITFPTDAFIQIGNGSGTLDIVASARDAAGKEVDTGSGSATIAAGHVVTVDVQMQGGSAPLAWSPGSWDFGAVAVGKTAGPVTLVLSNAGTLPGGAVDLALSPPGAFVLSADGCSGQALAPGASCTVDVSYSPTAAGQATATLTASANPGRSASVTLSGLGGYGVTVMKQGTGTGTVALADGTPFCPESCTSATAVFVAGSTVTLVGTPGASSALRGWSANCLTSGSTCSLTVDAGKVVTATFNAQVTLTVGLTGTGGGTIASSPPGIDCPATCDGSFDQGSTVTLTAAADGASTLAGWSVSSCGTSTTCQVTLNSAQAVTAAFTCNFDWSADAVNGSDSNSGTCSSPFKTLKKALASAANGDSILVRPGLYDASGNGESFPLQVPAGVKVIGDEASKGAGSAPITVTGAGLVPPSTTVAAAMAAATNSTIAGLTITGAYSGTAPSGVTAMGVVPTGNGVTIRNDTITAGTGNGIHVASNTTNHVITGNRIVNHQGAGVAYAQSSAGGKAEDNEVTGNKIGFEFDTAGGDLGGGPATSAGGNVISCNTQNDIWTNQNITINAANNFWDHQPPTSGCGSADLCGNSGLFGSTTFVTTNAGMATNACP